MILTYQSKNKLPPMFSKGLITWNNFVHFYDFSPIFLCRLNKVLQYKSMKMLWIFFPS